MTSNKEIVELLKKGDPPEFCSFKTKKSPFIPVFIRDCGDFIFV